MKFKSLTSFFSGSSEENTSEETTQETTTETTTTEETTDETITEETAADEVTTENETQASAETSEEINWQERYAQANALVESATAELNLFGETPEARAEFRRTAQANATFVENLRSVGITMKADITTLGEGGQKSYEEAPWNKAAKELREKQSGN